MNELSRRPAVLAGLCTEKPEQFGKSMKELAALCEAADIEPEAVFTQNLPKPIAGTYIGSGKISEIRAYLDEKESTGERIDLVIFDRQLSPMQLKNLADALGAEVFDRTALILKIFAERARTREASLQVEYARLEYLLPRLRGMHDDLGRQAGASGAMSNKGSGEKKIELDRRRIEKRMAELRRELELIDRERNVQRKARMKSALPRISLVGYTNAGKSTILNGLLAECGPDDGKKVYTADMLFATLDTTTRRIEPPDGGIPFLLSDTVGFIDHLPTSLVKAFRSTLEEAAYADLLLVVSDVSDPEYRDHLSVTVRTLEEIGAGEIPRIFVFNKADRRPASQNISHKDLRPEDGQITMSAADPEDLKRLFRLLEETLQRRRTACRLLIPYSEGKILSELLEDGSSDVVAYRENGTELQCSLSREMLNRCRRFLVEPAGEND